MVADGCCTKTFLECFPVMTAMTLPTFLEQWLKGKFLPLRTDGETAGSASHPRGTESLSGVLLTLNSFERPRSEEGACSLYSILEHGGVDPRFYLSAKACRGILSRANRHGKVLPEVLMTALTQIAEGGSMTSFAPPSPRETKTMSDDSEDE